MYLKFDSEKEIKIRKMSLIININVFNHKQMLDPKPAGCSIHVRTTSRQ